MSTFVWKKLGSPTLQPSSITFHNYDGNDVQPYGVLTNFPVELARKKVLIDIQVFNTQLDYNLLLGCIYMYAMRVISYTIF